MEAKWSRANVLWGDTSINQRLFHIGALARESSSRNATLSLARVFLLISRAPASKTTALRRPEKKKKKQYSFNRLAYFLPHQLKPYVSMKAPKTTSPELTAEDLLKNIKENIHLIKYREIP